MSEDSKRVAVIDIGTNSARLLVADVAGGRVSPVERRSRVTRLGRGVDLSGQLSAEAIEDACEAIGDYVADLPEPGAERGRCDRDQRGPRRRQRQRLRRRAARALRALGPGSRRRGGGAAHLPGRHLRAAADRADPRDRHRRRLDRADRRQRRARSPSTPRCRPASSATPSATSPPTPPPPSSWRRSPPTCAA